ncbi:MAG: hypothetical protein O7B81_02800 [Gammaproteobacteria bacterium]|nr:hypothetical protein [Gammaproteobacteria bacterium]
MGPEDLGVPYYVQPHGAIRLVIVADTRRLFLRLAALLSLCVALAAGSCHPPVESRFPLSEPGEVELDPRLAGTWGFFDEKGKLENILQIGPTDGPQVNLMLQWLNGDPPLYMTGFASEVDGMTIYNVKRVAGIGSDYTLMARDGCRPFSPAHEPGYMLFWATLGDDGDSMSVHPFKLTGGDLHSTGIELENHTNELYASTRVIESDRNTVTEYIGDQEQDEYSEYLENLQDEPKEKFVFREEIKNVYRLRRHSDAQPSVAIPVRFAAKAEALLEIVNARYAFGDTAGIAGSFAEIQPILECRGIGKLSDVATVAYLRLLVISGETGAALALAQSKTDELRESSYQAIAEAQLLIGDIAGARRTREHVTEAENRRILDYFTAVTAMTQGDQAGALALLDGIVAEEDGNVILLRMIADDYVTLGKPDRAETALDKAARQVLSDISDQIDFAGDCEEEIVGEDTAKAVLKLIMLDRRTAARPIVEQAKPCISSADDDTRELWLTAFVLMDDPELARFLASVAETSRAAKNETSIELHLAAAYALIRADLPAEAVSFLQAPGVVELLTDVEQMSDLNTYNLAVGAIAATQSRAGEIDAARAIAASIIETPLQNLEEAESLGEGAIAFAALIAHGNRLPSDILFVAFFVAFTEGREDMSPFINPFTYPDYQERFEQLRHAMLNNPVAQEILSAARQQVERTITASAADEVTDLQTMFLPGLDVMVLLRQFTDATFVASQDVERDSAQTEALASASIRVDNHTGLALTLALLGDLDGARKSVALAHAAAMEFPATGARKHASGGLIDLPGVPIR